MEPAENWPLSFRFFILVALSVASVAIYQIDTIGKNLSTISQKNMPMIEILGELSVRQLEQRILLQRTMRLNNGPDREVQLRNAERAFGELSRKIRNQVAAREKIARNALRTETIAAPRNAFDDALGTLKKVRQEHHDLAEHTVELMRLVIQDRNADAAMRFAAVERKAGHITDELNALLDRFRADTQDTAKRMENYNKTRLSGSNGPYCNRRDFRGSIRLDIDQGCPPADCWLDPFPFSSSPQYSLLI